MNCIFMLTILTLLVVLLFSTFGYYLLKTLFKPFFLYSLIVYWESMSLPLLPRMEAKSIATVLEKRNYSS